MTEGFLYLSCVCGRSAASESKSAAKNRKKREKEKEKKTSESVAQVILSHCVQLLLGCCGAHVDLLRCSDK